MRWMWYWRQGEICHTIPHDTCTSVLGTEYSVRLAFNSAGIFYVYTSFIYSFVHTFFRLSTLECIRSFVRFPSIPSSCLFLSFRISFLHLICSILFCHLHKKYHIYQGHLFKSLRTVGMRKKIRILVFVSKVQRLWKPHTTVVLRVFLLFVLVS